MQILIQHHLQPGQCDTRALAALARRVAESAMRAGGAPDNSETSILFVGDDEMREINREHRDIDQTTDVLAFAMREGDELSGPPDDIAAPEMLGDIVVSVDAAQRQALARGHSPRRETAILLIHGALHLLGHDHQAQPGPAGAKQTREMRQMEKKCLGILEDKWIV